MIEIRPVVVGLVEFCRSVFLLELLPPPPLLAAESGGFLSAELIQLEIL